MEENICASAMSGEAIVGCEDRMHGGCVNNCHTFVADVLNHGEYLTPGGCGWWNMVRKCSAILARIIYSESDRWYKR